MTADKQGFRCRQLIYVCIPVGRHRIHGGQCGQAADVINGGVGKTQGGNLSLSAALPAIPRRG